MRDSRRADCSRRPVRPFLIPDVARLNFCNFPGLNQLFKIGCRIWKHFMIHLTDIRQKRLPVKGIQPQLMQHQVIDRRIGKPQKDFFVQRFL